MSAAKRTAYCRAATLPKRTAYCCDYIATPRKSLISCDPEAQFGFFKNINHVTVDDQQNTGH
ncbi:hypothetical protein [Methanosarcina sp. 1.H.A.2.2]|uniref:hypothetical protein n=1 Tax=Methanosarcina sp. 1.H.A.2.2 TaxID=1483601 RepID=UPI0012E0A2E5|nr:hypothetical protein [Methanosarcina sp. 1.H.A.2.2]